MCPEWTSESWCKEDSNVNLKPLIIQMRGTDARRVLARCTPPLASSWQGHPRNLSADRNEAILQCRIVSLRIRRHTAQVIEILPAHP